MKKEKRPHRANTPDLNQVTFHESNNTIHYNYLKILFWVKARSHSLAIAPDLRSGDFSRVTWVQNSPQACENPALAAQIFLVISDAIY